MSYSTFGNNDEINDNSLNYSTNDVRIKFFGKEPIANNQTDNAGYGVNITSVGFNSSKTEKPMSVLSTSATSMTAGSEITEFRIGTAHKKNGASTSTISDRLILTGGKVSNNNNNQLILNNPYPNFYYTEDRVLWNNLAVQNRLISINHKAIRKRIPIKSKRMKLIKAIKSQFSSMTVAFGYTPNAINTIIEYLIRVKKVYKSSFVFSIITLIFLLPSFIYGRFFNRQSFLNQMKGNPRDLSRVSLRDIEEQYFSQYGRLNLNKHEREIFIN